MRLTAACLILSLTCLTAAPPAAVDDAFSTPEDVSITRPAAQGLMTNDTRGTAAAPVSGLVTSPLHGTVTLSPDGGFSFAPAVNYHGPDSFDYRIFGDLPSTQFTIDEQNSTLTVGATLRLVFEDVPSYSSDSATSNVRGAIAAGIAPNAAPFSVVQVTSLEATLTDAVSLQLGVGCILTACLAAVEFNAPAEAISLGMETAGPVATARSNGGFDADGSTFSVVGEGTVQGTGQLAEFLPPTALPLALPAITMPFNGRLTASGGQARLEMQINYRGTVALDASTVLGFSISGTIRANAPLPLAPVEQSDPATVHLTITPVNDAPVAGSDSYLVRAGTTLEVSASGTQTAQQIINAGATWKYHHTGTDLGTAWRSWNYNDSAWPAGPAELGYGDAGLLGGNRTEATNIRGSAARPTAYFRRDFTLSDVNSTRSLTFELLRDDGAAVYLNGIEVARQNLAAGASYNTLADSRIPNAAETQFFPATVPPELLIEGRNVIAVEVHQFSLTDFFSLQQVDPADVSFDFKLSRQTGLTGVLVNDTDIDSAVLTATVETPPAHGQLTLQPDGAFTYTPDAGFAGADTFLYRVSDGGTELAELKLIATGATWKYLDDGSDQGTAWRATAFSDAGWNNGAAEIGYGDDNTLDDRPETTKLSYLLSTPPVTTYFRKSFTLPLPKAMLQSLKLRLLRDDGAAVFLNGVEIARDNLPADANFETGAILPIEGELEATWMEYTVSAAGIAALNDSANVLAVELHQHLNVSNDASFDCELIATAQPGGRVTLNVSAEDFDNDGMADSWERTRGLDFAVPDGDADPDGDGQTNRQEFLADTDPLNRASSFRILSLTQSDSGRRSIVLLRIPASMQRRYVLQKSADLTSWTDDGAPVTPTGAELEFQFPAPPGGDAFYRVRVDYQFP
jgi:hypothetical protein